MSVVVVVFFTISTKVFTLSSVTIIFN